MDERERRSEGCDGGLPVPWWMVRTGEWRLVGRGCLFLKLRRAKSPIHARERE